MGESLQIAQVAGGIRNQSARFSRLGDDYIFSRAKCSALRRDQDSAPIRFNGVTLFLCREGECTAEINMEKYVIKARTLAVVEPSSLVALDDGNSAAGDMLFLSSHLMNEVHLDPGAIRRSRLDHNKSLPIVRLTKEEFDLMDRYMELLHYNAIENADSHYAKYIARTLASAVIYQILQIFMSHAEKDITATETEQISTRRMNYVRRFSILLQEHFRRERSVGFYAEKLCISPKYLSHVVKETTGRSAASWIDQYVILEAKNLLRFSGRNVQQVTYDLNFPNQSSFGKYFKHLTGMSPTEYQRS